MSKKPGKPSESLVQELLAERRQLKVALERARLELADAQGNAGDQDPRIPQLQAELTRLRTQLDETRAEVNLLRTERDDSSRPNKRKGPAPAGPFSNVLSDACYFAQASIIGTYEATIDPSTGKFTRRPLAWKARMTPTSQSRNQTSPQMKSRIPKKTTMIVSTQRMM